MHPQVRVAPHNIMLLESYRAQKYHGVILRTVGLSECKLSYSTTDKRDCSTAWGFYSGMMFVQDVLIKRFFIGIACVIN